MTTTDIDASLGQDPDAPAEQGARTEVERRHLFIFRLGVSYYAVSSSVVDHVGALAKPTPVPTAPSQFLGVVHVRGRVIAVVDLGSVLGATPEEKSQGDDESFQERLVVLDADRTPFAVPADSVLGLREVEVDSIRPASVLPQGDASDESSLFEGEFDDRAGVVTLLRIEAVLQILRKLAPRAVVAGGIA